MLRSGLPAHERHAAVAVKGPLRRAVLAGIAVGAGIVVAAAIIIAIGAAIDPVVERRLDDVEDIGTAPWQLVLMVLSLVVLAPLGEELLFRGLLLRGLARRLRFWPAALISCRPLRVGPPRHLPPLAARCRPHRHRGRPGVDLSATGILGVGRRPRHGQHRRLHRPGDHLHHMTDTAGFRTIDLFADLSDDALRGRG